MPTSVEKIIVYARKLCLQHNVNWPEKLPKYFAQKRSICKAICFSGSESISVALVNYKGLEQPATPPSNAISMATKGNAVEKSPDSKIRMPVLQVGWISRGASLPSMNLCFLIDKMGIHCLCCEVQMRSFIITVAVDSVLMRFQESTKYCICIIFHCYPMR